MPLTESLTIALIGLLGAIIGGAASFAATYVTLRAQARSQKQLWLREDEIRFHKERYELYSRFVEAAASAEDRARSVSTRLQFYPDLSDELIKKFIDRLSSAANSVDQLSGAVSLVASEEVRMAVRRVALETFQLTFVEVKATTKDEFDAWIAQLREAIRGFEGAARKELGIVRAMGS